MTPSAGRCWAHLSTLQLLQGLPEVTLQVCHLQLEPPGCQGAALRLGRGLPLLSLLPQSGLQRVHLPCLGLQLLLLAGQLGLQAQEPSYRRMGTKKACSCCSWSANWHRGSNMI